MACDIASSEACETLITIPSRFISAMRVFPREFKPCQREGEQQLSASRSGHYGRKVDRNEDPSHRNGAAQPDRHHDPDFLQVEYRGYFPARYDAIDVPSPPNQFSRLAVLFQLT